MKTIFYTALIAAFTTLAAAFPNGSPVCSVNATQLLAVPNTPMGKQGDLGFSMTYNFPNNQYTPGKAYKISLKGNGKFQGLLLWSLAADKSHPGQFNLPNGFKYVTAACPGDPKGTVTQTDATPKDATDFMWTAPTGASTGPIQFVAAFVGGTPTQFQIVKDGKMFNAVGGTAPTTNNNSTGNGTTTAPMTSTTDTSGSGSGYGSDTGSATTTSVSPTDSTTANAAQGGSNVSASNANSSDAQSLRSTSSWIILGSTLVLAKFLVAFV